MSNKLNTISNSAQQEFHARYNNGDTQLISLRISEQNLSPETIFLRIREAYSHPFFLESSESQASKARYSVIGCDPTLVWQIIDNEPRIAKLPNITKFASEKLKPLDSLRKLVKSCEFQLPEDTPDVASGLFGYIGYDCVKFAENLPDINAKESKIPDAFLIRPRLTAVFDLADSTCTAYALVQPQSDVTSQCALQQSIELLDNFAQIIQKPVSEDLEKLDKTIGAKYSANIPKPSIIWKNSSFDSSAEHKCNDSDNDCGVEDNLAQANEWQINSNLAQNQYLDMVKAAKEYILAGDAFQIVISQRFESEFKADPFSFYNVLRQVNPSPYLFYIDFDDFVVTGSSPELLVRLRDDVVTIRPLAGTRPRGKTQQEDLALELDLQSDPKELAEHLMLLDLGRNDVGRVSKIGGVSITQQFAVEKYSAVMHIVSEVIGDISNKYDSIDALIAGFPAGTLSGAPKIRAMEIIEELEPTRRGVYAGAIGYFSASGNMDTCIAIRTAVIADEKITIQAGAGIVADSNPITEDQECWNKALALLRSSFIAQNL